MMINDTAILLAFLVLFPLTTEAQKVKPGFAIGHARQAVSLDFSADGSLAVSAGGDGDGFVKLWETATGRLIKTWDPAADIDLMSKTVYDVAFYGEDHILVCAKGKPLQAWEYGKEDKVDSPFLLETDAEAVVVESYGFQPSEYALTYLVPGEDPVATVTAVALNPKNVKELLTLDDQNRLRTWQVKSRRLMKTFDPVDQKITSICYSADGRSVLSGTSDGQVIVWNAKSGDLGERMPMHSEAVVALDVSTGGEYALSGTLSDLVLWDISSRKKVKTFQGAYIPGYTARFSPDGKTIAYGALGRDPMVVIWDIAGENEYQLVDTLKKIKDANVLSVSFSLNGEKLLSGYFDGTILQWDLVNRVLDRRLEGKPRKIRQIGFVQDHQVAFILYDTDPRITIWNGKRGDEKTLYGHTGDLLTAQFSPVESFLLSGAEDHYLIKWDYVQGSVLWKSGKLDHPVSSIAISPDGKYAMTAGYRQKQVDVWDLEKMEVVRSLNDHSLQVSSLAFSDDGRLAMTGANDNTVNVYEIAANWEKVNIPGQTNRKNPVAFSPDGKYFLSVSCLRNLMEVWSIEEKRLLKTFKMKDYQGLPEYPFSCGEDRPVFSPDGQLFLMPSHEGAYLWDLSGEKQPVCLHGHTRRVESVAFVAGGRVAVTGAADGTVKLWNVKTGEELVTIYQLSNNNWAAITPNGLFDAAPASLSEMYFVKELETIDLEQLKDTYYEPDLLVILMGYKKGRLRDVGVLDELEMYPEISAGIRNNKLQIDLTERSGGIGKVSIFINGSEVLEDACGGNKNCPPIDLEQFKSHYFASEEKLDSNIITILAYNRDEWLKSPPYEMYPFPKSSRGGPGGLKNVSFGPRPDPGLHAIVIGTSNYQGENIDLTFPDKDASAIATSIRNIATPFFKGSVEVDILTTNPSDESKWPSKSKIRSTFMDVAARTNAEDVFFLFLSGHGVTYTDENHSDFYYLTMDCGDMNLAASDRRKNFCISTDTLTEWIKKIPAKKRVVVLDACYSGKAAENLFASRSISASQERELERLKDRTGMFVLASSEAGQLSWENKNLQQGLLTYSLLFGLQNTDGFVDVSKLFNYARDYVPQLAEGIDEDQTPVLTVPSKKASSFPIGKVDETTDIPISVKSNFIAPCLFLDKNRMDDHLFLSNIIDEYLAGAWATGRLGKMVFTTSPRKKDVYAIRGMYEVQDNDKVVLNGRVFKGGQEIQKFKLEGKRSDTSQMWQQKIVEAVNGVL